MARKRKKKAKKPKYVGVQTREQLDEGFYMRLDPSFLMNKAEALLLITENPDEFKEIVKKDQGDPDAVEGKFSEGLRAEIHFAEFHQFEALMALLLAPWQPLPHWIYMTTYTTGEVKEASRRLIAGDAEGLTGGRVKAMPDYARWAVYRALASSDADQRARWDENLENVAWVLQYLARRYDEATEYNAYKHGVRVFAGPHAMTIAPDDAREKVQTLAASPDSISFLEIKKEEDVHRLYLTTRHINPVHSVNNLMLMYKVLVTIKNTRLAHIRGEKRVQIEPFFTLDKSALVGLDPVFRSSFTM